MNFIKSLSILLFSMLTFSSYSNSFSRFGIDIIDYTGFATPSSIQAITPTVALPQVYPYPIYMNTKYRIIWQNSGGEVAQINFSINSKTANLYMANNEFSNLEIMQIENSPVTDDTGTKWYIGKIDPENILTIDHSGMTVTTINGYQDQSEIYYGAVITINDTSFNE